MVSGLHLLRGMTKTEPERVKILWCMPIAGPLYRVQAEDGELYCYDWTFRAATTTDGSAFDGRTFEHASYVVRGAIKTPESFWVANYNHRNEAEAFCRFLAAGRPRGHPRGLHYRPRDGVGEPGPTSSSSARRSDGAVTGRSAQCRDDRLRRYRH